MSVYCVAHMRPAEVCNGGPVELVDGVVEDRPEGCIWEDTSWLEKWREEHPGSSVSGAPDFVYTRAEREEFERLEAARPKRLEGGHEHDGDGPPYVWVWEMDDGTLRMALEEFEAQVDFCPLCGHEARIKGAQT